MDAETIYFTRNIEMNARDVSDREIVIEGVLRDTRHCPSFNYGLQSLQPPGIFHCIKVGLNISVPELVILNATSEMIIVPHELCHGIENAVSAVIGLKIGTGFVKRLRERTGGAKGCLHMNNLIQDMASAAVQAYWSKVSRHKSGKEIKIPRLDPMVINSCWLWRPDGPYIRQINELREKEG